MYRGVLDIETNMSKKRSSIIEVLYYRWNMFQIPVLRGSRNRVPDYRGPSVYIIAITWYHDGGRGATTSQHIYKYIVTHLANNIFFSIFFQVSWIRKSDSYILSVDSAVFISDNRFKILRPQPGTEWNLHIK